jgi:hypothetical protein
MCASMRATWSGSACSLFALHRLRGGHRGRAAGFDEVLSIGTEVHIHGDGQTHLPFTHTRNVLMSTDMNGGCPNPA